VLLFPCNQFGAQEPGTAAEIKQFASTFGSNFMLFEKANVNGADARPVFQYLQHELGGTLGDGIKWNFTKFLVDRQGRPRTRYSPTTAPSAIEDAIKALLEEPASKL